MICSVLPLGAFVSFEASSRMSLSLSLVVSPACQRLLHRVMEAGIGLAPRQAPFAYWKKSVHGSVLRSRSLTSIPRSPVACASSHGEHNSNTTARRCLRMEGSSPPGSVKSLEGSRPLYRNGGAGRRLDEVGEQWEAI